MTVTQVASSVTLSLASLSFASLADTDLDGYGEGRGRVRDLGCSGDVGHIEFIHRDRHVWRGTRDFGRKRYGDDHRDLRLCEQSRDYDGESGRVERHAVTDESVVRFVG